MSKHSDKKSLQWKKNWGETRGSIVYKKRYRRKKIWSWTTNHQEKRIRRKWFEKRDDTVCIQHRMTWLGTDDGMWKFHTEHVQTERSSKELKTWAFLLTLHDRQGLSSWNYRWSTFSVRSKTTDRNLQQTLYMRDQILLTIKNRKRTKMFGICETEIHTDLSKSL